jgi:hypothetical protein
MRVLPAVAVLCLTSLLSVTIYDRLVVAPLREQLQHSLVDRTLLQQVRDAARAGQATPERPVVVQVAPQGAPPDVRPVPVQVTLQPPTVHDGRTAPSRVIADSPPVYCRTREECDRLYQRAPQALTVDGQVRAGTVVTVCLEALDAEGRCPEGRRANLPLAEPVRFTAQFVLSERGVFQGLNVVGAPLEITRVRTETAVEVRVGPPPLPYHLAATIRVSTAGTVIAGLRYTNRLGAGLYEIEAALRYDAGASGGHAIIRDVWIGYVLPLR